MSVIVYGCSDDLIEVEGDVREEFDVTNLTGWDGESDGYFIACSDGTVLRVSYHEVWRITPVCRGTADLAIVQCPEDDPENYSDRATLTGDIAWVVLGAAIATAKRPKSS